MKKETKEEGRFTFYSITGSYDEVTTETTKIFAEFSVQSYATQIVNKTLQGKDWLFIIKRLTNPCVLNRRILQREERALIRRRFNKVHEAMVREMSLAYQNQEQKVAEHIGMGLMVIEAILGNPDYYARSL